MPQSVLWTRSGRGLIAGAVGLVLLGLIIGRLLGGSTAALAPQPTPTATVTPIPFAPIPGAVVAVAETRGESAGLGGPLDVAALPDGHVAVADTANGRLVILNAAGHIVGNPKPGEGGLRQPYAVVYSAGGLDVLDAEADAIMRFDSGGRFVGVVLHDSALHLARGMNVGPDGRLYVANPLTNSILVISPHGKIQSQIHTPNGKAPGEFDQVSDVAVGADGTIYALDNQNNRIEALSASGSYLAQWPAPPSSTLASVHILPLSGGRLLATDPSGALLAYQPGGGSPTRSSLTLNGQVLTSVEPLGLVMTAHGRLLVADGHGNRVLVVTLPPALR